jgi:hypothetical protein
MVMFLLERNGFAFINPMIIKKAISFKVPVRTALRNQEMPNDYYRSKR